MVVILIGYALTILPTGWKAASDFARERMLGS
jgi:hypothetical protein